MASFWDDIFSEDTLNTITSGMNQAGSFFNAASPLINAASQLGFGAEGTRNAAGLRQATQRALTELDQLFTPDSAYAKEARRQMERKDAAAGRRSQYGTRETELAANLAKQRASVLNSPAYQAMLVGANRSDYAPIAGAIGNLTGGMNKSPLQQAASTASNLRSAGQAGQYLANIFGPGAEASIAQGIGGAGSALGGSGIMGGGLGTTDTLGSLLGTGNFLPGYSSGAEGIFGGAQQPGASQGGLFGDAGAALGGAGDLAAAGLGGAGSALSGMGAGSLAGTVGGADALGGILGGTGFLPSYGAAGGTTATGLFGGGTAAGAGAGGAGGAGGGTASGLGGLGTAAGVALPAAVLLGGLLSMFQQGTQPIDITQDWLANQGGLNQQNFNQYRAESPTLDALINQSMVDNTFDVNKWQDAVRKATVGGKGFTDDALQQATQFGQTLQANPGWFGGQQAQTPSWFDPYAQGTPSN